MRPDRWQRAQHNRPWMQACVACSGGALRPGKAKEGSLHQVALLCCCCVLEVMPHVTRSQGVHVAVF